MVTEPRLIHSEGLGEVLLGMFERDVIARLGPPGQREIGEVGGAMLRYGPVSVRAGWEPRCDLQVNLSPDRADTFIIMKTDVGVTASGVTVGTSYVDLVARAGDLGYNEEMELWTSAAEVNVWFDVVHPMPGRHPQPDWCTVDRPEVSYVESIWIMRPDPPNPVGVWPPPSWKPTPWPPEHVHPHGDGG